MMRYTTGCRSVEARSTDRCYACRWNARYFWEIPRDPGRLCLGSAESRFVREVTIIVTSLRDARPQRSRLGALRRTDDNSLYDLQQR